VTPPVVADEINSSKDKEVIMTKGIIVAISIFAMLVAACAKEDESRMPGGRASNPGQPNKPTQPAEPVNTGRDLDPADFPNVPNSIFGAWDSDTAEFGDGLVYLLTLYFNDDDEVGMKRTCVGSGEEVAAATVVDGEVSTSKIKITQTATVQEKGGRITDCALTINTGSFSYKRTGDRLDVTFKPGQTRGFTRAKK
jgi:hypothetical protein